MPTEIVDGDRIAYLAGKLIDGYAVEREGLSDLEYQILRWLINRHHLYVMSNLRKGEERINFLARVLRNIGVIVK